MTVYLTILAVLVFNLVGLLFTLRYLIKAFEHLERIEYWIGIHSPLIDTTAVRVPGGTLKPWWEEIK